MNKKTFIFGVLLTISGFNATANDYKFIEAGLTKVDNVSDKPWHIAGSYPIDKDFSAVASYSKRSSKSNNRSYKSTLWTAGVSYHKPMNEIASDTDGIIDVRYVSSSEKSKDDFWGSSSGDRTGFNIKGKLQRKMTNEIKANAGLHYIDVGKNSDTDFIGGVNYKLSSNNLSLGLDTVAFDEWTFYVRMNLD